MSSIRATVHLHIHVRGNKNIQDHCQLHFTQTMEFPSDTSLLAPGMTMRFPKGWSVDEMTMLPEDETSMLHPIRISHHWYELPGNEPNTPQLHVRCSTAQVNVGKHHDFEGHIARLRDVAQQQHWTEVLQAAA